MFVSNQGRALTNDFNLQYYLFLLKKDKDLVEPRQTKLSSEKKITINISLSWWPALKNQIDRSLRPGRTQDHLLFQGCSLLTWRKFIQECSEKVPFVVTIAWGSWGNSADCSVPLGSNCAWKKANAGQWESLSPHVESRGSKAQSLYSTSFIWGDYLKHKIKTKQTNKQKTSYSLGLFSPPYHSINLSLY